MKPEIEITMMLDNECVANDKEKNWLEADGDEMYKVEKVAKWLSKI